jgi:hypothetical protein
VFDPERMIEPISVRGLDSAAAAREGALELLRAFSASMPREVEDGCELLRGRHRCSQENVGGGRGQRRRKRVPVRVPAVGHDCERTAESMGMVAGADRAGSCDGIHSAIWETGVAGVGGAISALVGTSTVEPRSWWR